MEGTRGREGGGKDKVTGKDKRKKEAIERRVTGQEDIKPVGYSLHSAKN